MDVIVLDGTDLPNPETMAMVQALYSRSPQSITKHLEQVRVKGADRFMSQYYVGYSHKSIGDCGTITIFVEDVSMICAKAIQDNPLYNGQEASTRYLDFAGRDIVDPAGTTASGKILHAWLSFYKDILNVLVADFEKRFPREDGQKKGIWKKAVKARAFDVARGFLPAGCTTFVAWHTNLRQAHDHLQLMKHNPVAEIREVAEQIHIELKKRYPSSFGHKVYPEQERYIASSQAAFAFSDRELEPFRWRSSLNRNELAEHRHLLESRPAKTELHQRLRQYGTIEFRFPLDFGGYRDLQRHRSCVQEMPLLTTKHGIHPWYIEQLPEKWQKIALNLAEAQAKEIEALDISPEEKQNYVAMGFTCAIKIDCNLPSAVYIAELRSGTTVHPTVRKIAQQMGEFLQGFVPGLAMHHDMSEGVWDIKRGTQDIVKKG